MGAESLNERNKLRDSNDESNFESFISRHFLRVQSAAGNCYGTTGVNAHARETCEKYGEQNDSRRRCTL
jgi:hypothetical protein